MLAAAGAFGGVEAAWQGSLVSILVPLGFSGAQAGAIGFVNGVGFNVGAVGFSALVVFALGRRRAARDGAARVDERAALNGAAEPPRSWQDVALRSRRAQIIGWLVVLVVTGFGFAVLCGYDLHALPYRLITLVAFVMGVGQGSPRPLLFELAADLTYPLPEGSSASAIVTLWNAVCLVVLCADPFIADRTVMNWVRVGVLVVCLALMLRVREGHARPADATAPRSDTGAINSTC